MRSTPYTPYRPLYENLPKYYLTLGLSVDTKGFIRVFPSLLWLLWLLWLLTLVCCLLYTLYTWVEEEEDCSGMEGSLVCVSAD